MLDRNIHTLISLLNTMGMMNLIIPVPLHVYKNWSLIISVKQMRGVVSAQNEVQNISCKYKNKEMATIS